MKKILLFITVAGLAVSCSDDVESGGGGNSGGYVLLKKQVETATDGTTLTTNYSYDGNKLTSVTHSDGTNEAYAYTDNFITEIRHYENGGLVEKEAFTYGPSGIATHVSYFYDLANPSNNNALKYVYTANGNTVTVTKFTGDDSSQTTPAGTATLTLTNNGNITQYQSGNTSISYGFDGNSSSFREIAGYQAVTLAQFEGGANNITTIQVNNNGAITNTLTTYTYLANYPVTSTYTNAQGSSTTTAYTY